jgi:RNA polymerase sigma factor (TIGR02999 family)
VTNVREYIDTLALARGFEMAASEHEAEVPKARLYLAKLDLAELDSVPRFAASKMEGDVREKVRMPDPVPANEEVAQRPDDVTKLLLAWRNGDRSALDRLTPIIYDDLLKLAKARLKSESHRLTLEPTALVHESYLRLADETSLKVENRAHFFAIAANVMRRVLIDYARKRSAEKRDAGAQVTLKTNMDFADDRPQDLMLVDEALRKLAEFDERKSQAIELKFFGGMTTEEIGTVLGISVATVGRELRIGQAWLRREMSRREPSPSSL